MRGLGYFSKTSKNLRKNNGFLMIFQSRSLTKTKPNVKIKTELAREGLLRRKPQHKALWDRSFGVLGCVWALWGHCWGTFGRSWDALRAVLGRAWALLGCSWASPGAFWTSLGALGAVVGRSWGDLERSEADLERFVAFLGACFVRRFSLNALSVPPLGQVQDQFETVSEGF